MSYEEMSDTELVSAALTSGMATWEAGSDGGSGSLLFSGHSELCYIDENSQPELCSGGRRRLKTHLRMKLDS